MRLVRRPLVAIPLLFAVLASGLAPARAADATRAEVDAYVAEISARQDALGENLVILGRIIEITLRNPDAVDTEAFWGGVDRVETFFEEKGDEEALKAMAADLEGDDLRALHQVFLRCLRSFKEADALIKRADYHFSPEANDVWNESRLDFLSFTDDLGALMTKHGIARPSAPRPSGR